MPVLLRWDSLHGISAFRQVRFLSFISTELVFGALSVLSGIACYNVTCFMRDRWFWLLCCVLSAMHWASAFTAAIRTRRYCSPPYVFIQLRQPV